MAKAWHPRLTTWVDVVEARWQRLGLSAIRRGELRADLVTDLAQALVAGAPLEELLAVDPERFAVDVAVAHGWVPNDVTGEAMDKPASSISPRALPRSVRGEASISVRVVVAGLLGTTVGGVVGLVALLPFVGWVLRHTPYDYALQALGMLAIYATAALLAAVSGGLAVASACADRPDRRQLGLRVTAALILSGVTATLVTVGYARSTEYSTRTSVVLTELGLVFGTLVVGLVIAARTSRPVRPGAIAHTK